MIKHSYIILALAIVAFSCNRHKGTDVESFVYANGYSLSTDSTGKPQFALRKYLEYAPNQKMKIATGPKRQYFYLDSTCNCFKSDPASIFGLDRFYSGDYSKELGLLIKKFSETEAIDTTYTCDNEFCDYNLFVLKFYNGDVKVIDFCSYCVPDRFQKFINVLNETIDTNKMVKSYHFKVNDLVGVAQSRFFKKLPPPPLPSK